MASYNQLHNGFESLTHKHMMPTIGSLEAIRNREVIFQQIRYYIEKIKKVTEHEDLEVTKYVIQ